MRNDEDTRRLATQVFTAGLFAAGVTIVRIKPVRTMHLHEIFVSYQSRDRIWVERFVADLQLMVSRLLGRDVLVWWDRQNIGPGDDWESKMINDARTSRVFVPVISPSWTNSRACKQELDAFLESAQSECLFPAILLPIENQPAAIRKATHVKFFRPENRRELTGTSRKAEVHRLAGAIAKRLPKDLPRAKAGVGIARIAATTRERIAPDILDRCGWMRILNMTQSIDTSEIYTEVKIFPQARFRRSIEEFKATPQLVDQYDVSSGQVWVHALLRRDTIRVSFKVDCCMGDVRRMRVVNNFEMI